MKRLPLCFALVMLVTVGSSQIPAGLDETARQMQEYMVQREELANLRRAALEKIKDAKNEKEKQQQLDKLEADAKPVQAKVDAAMRAYKAAVKAQKAQAEQFRPRN
jgi:hypothetical protein